jgi:hypothetical protein
VASDDRGRRRRFAIGPTAGAPTPRWPLPPAALVGQLVGDARRLKLAAAAFGARLGARRAGRYDGRVAAAERRLKAGIGRSPDVILRTLRLGGPDGARALLAFVSGLADNQMVDQDAVALVERTTFALPATGSERAQAVAQVLSVGHVSYARRWKTIVAKILAGNAVVLVEGADRAVVLDTVQYQARSIEQPNMEQTVLGSQEAFNEILLTHMNQIRRYVQSPRLVFEQVAFGDAVATQGIVVYLDGVTNPAIVEAVKTRLKAIRDSTVLGLTRLASSLKDHAWTPFPLVRYTARVDFVAREVGSGKVAVMIANSPYALIVPATFLDFYRTSDDYEGQFWGPTLDRGLRLAGFLIALYAPALYVALTDVNPDFLPTRLLWTIAGSRENLPFPPVVEVLLMFGILEILREAALRMPQSMSTPLSTVGAVIIGTAVVNLRSPTTSAAAGLRATRR